MRNHSHVFQRMKRYGILTAATVTYFSRDLPLLLINFSRPVFISGSHCYKKISLMNSKTKDILPKTGCSLRKPPTFGDATTGSPPNDVWETNVEIPYRWRVTTQIWVLTRHQYGICALVSQMSFLDLDKFCRKNKPILRRAFCRQNKAFSSRISF